MNTRNLVIGGMLIGLSILIPMILGGTPLMVVIPPGFTATIASHLPSMLAMAISPGVAIMVGVGSAIGFSLRINLMIGARALTHSIFGGIGAFAYKKGMPFWLVLLITAPIHAILEGMVLLPFNVGLREALVVTGIGTFMHHLIDSGLSITLYHSLIKLSVLERPTLG